MSSKAQGIQDSAVSFFHTAKDTVYAWISKLNLNNQKIVEIVSFFGIGFFTGFLLKKYFKYVALLALLIFVLAFLLESSAIIHIDWNKLREVLGLSKTDTIDSMFYVLIDWVKANIVTSISALIGFVIGYKVA